jgi:hypothetical protein
MVRPTSSENYQGVVSLVKRGVQNSHREESEESIWTQPESRVKDPTTASRGSERAY